MIVNDWPRGGYGRYDWPKYVAQIRAEEEADFTGYARRTLQSPIMKDYDQLTRVLVGESHPTGPRWPDRADPMWILELERQLGIPPLPY